MIKSYLKKVKARYDFFKQNVFFSVNNLKKERQIFTHLTDQEKILLYSFVGKHKALDIVAVEIGSYFGASSCIIAAALKNKGTLYCIDTWENQTMPEGLLDTYEEFVKNTKKYEAVIVPLRGWSFDMAAKFKSINKKIDFLFIDGDHSYDGCKSDWDLYHKFLGSGSIIAFHDTGWAEGVQRVIRENVLCVASKVAELPNMQVFMFK